MVVYVAARQAAVVRAIPEQTGRGLVTLCQTNTGRVSNRASNRTLSGTLSGMLSGKLSGMISGKLSGMISRALGRARGAHNLPLHVAWQAGVTAMIVES